MIFDPNGLMSKSSSSYCNCKCPLRSVVKSTEQKVAKKIKLWSAFKHTHWLVFAIWQYIQRIKHAYTGGTSSFLSMKWNDVIMRKLFLLDSSAIVPMVKLARLLSCMKASQTCVRLALFRAFDHLWTGQNENDRDNKEDQTAITVALSLYEGQTVSECQWVSSVSDTFLPNIFILVIFNKFWIAWCHRRQPSKDNTVAHRLIDAKMPIRSVILFYILFHHCHIFYHNHHHHHRYYVSWFFLSTCTSRHRSMSRETSFRANYINFLLLPFDKWIMQRDYHDPTCSN